MRRFTFDQLSTVHFAGCDFEGNDVSLVRSVCDAMVVEREQRTAASLRSLIGIPIVLVILNVY